MGDRKIDGRMDTVEIVSLCFCILLLSFLVALLPLAIIHGTSGEDYTLDEVVDCNDEDGDVIEGLVCHEEIYCSEKLKFMNGKGCEAFIGGEE